jgi:hypothetical protein
VGITLVFAGNHRQYMQWVRDRMARGDTNASRARNILTSDQLRGFRGDDVDEVHLVGTYARDNEAWMSPYYEMLMADGRAAGKPWAMDETEDLRKAYEVPVPPEKMAATRARLEQMERELSE